MKQSLLATHICSADQDKASLLVSRIETGKSHERIFKVVATSLIAELVGGPLSHHAP
jgi:hypothetical protein